MQGVIISITVFIVIQLINVFLSTIKSVITVNGSKTTAAVINAISYTFGAVITKLLTQQSFVVAIVVTFLSNLVGVYAAKFFLEATRKEKLWLYLATITSVEEQQKIETELKYRNVKFTLLTAENDRYFITIFSYSKAESAFIIELLKQYHIKYSVLESQAVQTE